MPPMVVMRDSESDRTNGGRPLLTSPPRYFLGEADARHGRGMNGGILILEDLPKDAFGDVDRTVSSHGEYDRPVVITGHLGTRRNLRKHSEGNDFQ